MPVAAAIGGSIIGAGASILGGKKAAKATTKAAEANNALQAQIYEQNAAALSPWQKTGTAANQAQAALLGLYTPPAPPTTAPALTPQQMLGGSYPWGGYGAYAPKPTPTPPPVQNSATTAQQAQAQQMAAFDAFRNSSGYNFRLNQGQNSVTAALGSRGMLDSGAARRALTEYGQNFGSNEFGNYYNMLGGLSGTGLTAASAQAGVGQGYANAVSQNNNNAANATGNAALVGANGVNSALGSALSAYGYSQGLGSSYGGGGSSLMGAGGVYGNPYGGTLGGIY